MELLETIRSAFRRERTQAMASDARRRHPPSQGAALPVIAGLMTYGAFATAALGLCVTAWA